MAFAKGSKGWVLLVLIIAGYIIGTAIGMNLDGNGDFGILAEGINFGITDPFTFDVGFLTFIFGLSFTMNVGGAIGIILGILIYKALF